MTNWTFSCQNCGEHDIVITAEVALKVIQDPKTGGFETEPLYPDLFEYDDNSYATCQACNHPDKLKYFLGASDASQIPIS